MNQPIKYDFWVVAIGSSAGGLQPLIKMIYSLPENANATFVIIPHLLRAGKSQLDFLLSKHSKMPTIRAAHRMPIEPQKIYILPEGKLMTLKNGRLILRERQPEEIINYAIDTFFMSLASDAKEKAVGVILSGNGSDGLEGSKEIEKNNGIVIVQDPQTAESPGMPNAIIQSDTPNAILAPEEISYKIIQHTGLVK
ncbi:chemotaxis protein CheB [Mucilaginibacter sp. X4EP1]|jgi:two-component system CheB/CheR fusion protein|uniref:chemotaxis protein CheB n=1 Tax=Mucilaginibacter sp. X4EP1 TaxID=2723092 RepID=UPI00216A1DCF|nr:chemotaxis protein CheB [Mucilaginibacter sp. X4EP1]MCS3812074.1 two-component system CheB/CheR fusion protein [Mucilaginibacter sp. X4EP1]